MVNAHPEGAIARCLADNLSPYGYMLDLHETDIPGINKEFTVYYRNGAYIAGTFWIAKLNDNRASGTNSRNEWRQ